MAQCGPEKLLAHPAAAVSSKNDMRGHIAPIGRLTGAQDRSGLALGGTSRGTL